MLWAKRSFLLSVSSNVAISLLVAFEDLETAYGTRLLKVTDTFEGMDFVDIYTIYKGYEMEFVMAKIDGSDLTDDDVKMMVDFISDMDFVAE